MSNWKMVDGVEIPLNVLSVEGIQKTITILKATEYQGLETVLDIIIKARNYDQLVSGHRIRDLEYDRMAGLSPDQWITMLEKELESRSKNK